MRCKRLIRGTLTIKHLVLQVVLLMRQLQRLQLSRPLSHLRTVRRTQHRVLLLGSYYRRRVNLAFFILDDHRTEQLSVSFTIELGLTEYFVDLVPDAGLFTGIG